MDDIKCKDYLIVGIIDFGIIFLGYVFFIKYDFLIDLKNIKKINIKYWVDFISIMLYYKILICILFIKEKKFSEFGFDVEVKYLDLLFDDDNIDEKVKDWYFF